MSDKTQDARTLELLLDLARANFADQLTAARDVDSKIFQTFSAACVLIGLATLRGIKLPGHHHTWGVVFVCVAVAAFLVNAASALVALWSRRYRVPIGTRQLVDEYWYDPPTVLMDAFVHDAAAGYACNEKHHKAKHWALRVCLLSLLVEAAAIGASLIATNV